MAPNKLKEIRDILAEFGCPEAVVYEALLKAESECRPEKYTKEAIAAMARVSATTAVAVHLGTASPWEKRKRLWGGCFRMACFLLRNRKNSADAKIPHTVNKPTAALVYGR